MSKYYTYRIFNNINNKEYYGSTKNIKVRWTGHINRGRRLKNSLYRAMAEFGVENFYIEQLGVHSTKQEALEFENFLIMSNLNSYNIKKAYLTPEAFKEYKDNWRTANKDKLKQYSIKNTEYLKEYCKRRYNDELDDFRKRANKACVDWRQRNKEQANSYHKTDKYKEYKKQYSKTPEGKAAAKRARDKYNSKKRYL